jgi:hypothetical protein
VAVCNDTFVAAWTRGKITWAAHNDVLLGALMLVTCVTKCPVAMIGPFKKAGLMSVVYLLEGVAFIGGACLGCRYWGITGVLASAVVANILFTGAFGFRFVAKYFETTVHEMLFKWLANTWIYLLLMILIGAGVWWITRGLGQPPESASGQEGINRIYPLTRLAVQATLMSMAGLPLLWRVGLTPELRLELRGRIGSLVPDWARKLVVSTGG